MTIHEYFTAKKIVESTKSDEIIRLMREHAVDDQWREVLLMVSSILDDGRFLIDALLDVLDELAVNEPKIAKFIAAAYSLSVEKSATKVVAQYGSASYRAKFPFNSDAMVISDCCVAVAANMRMMDISEKALQVPRRIAAALQADPSLVVLYFQGSQEGLASVRNYFRLMDLVSECITLVALPDRKAYLENLFDPN